MLRVRMVKVALVIPLVQCSEPSAMLNRRVAGGLFLKSAYTYSHRIRKR